MITRIIQQVISYLKDEGFEERRDRMIKVGIHNLPAGKTKCNHIISGANTRFPEWAFKEWYSGQFADEPGGPVGLHYIHWTCMKCGEVFGDTPFGDTVNPYDAAKDRSKTSEVNK